ncbi:MAG: endonuclease/exonuclease/phosphatase family protein [Treponema sp.]|nr:endonuclease/exonuclease/phosphatase family protein [Treponema sp.]
MVRSFISLFSAVSSLYRESRFLRTPKQNLSPFSFAVLVLLLPVFYLSCTSCENPLAGKKPPSRFRIASWNLQAFFDGQETGTEYADYRAKSSWNEIAYKSRLTMLADAMTRWPEPQTRGERPGPDIFALVEVETSAVLEDLRSGPFTPFKYSYSAFTANPASPLGLGILSRFPILSTRSHSLQTESFSTPRPMLEAEIELPGEHLFLFVCHWKSKLGNPSETEAIRRASAELVNRRIHELSLEYPDTPPLVLVAGDLNENVDEYSRQGGTCLTALMPADISPESFIEATATPRAFIKLTGSPADLSDPPAPTAAMSAPATAAAAANITAAPATAAAAANITAAPAPGPANPAIFYSPWLNAPWPGSYAFQGAWETIDHILIGPAFFDNRGWEYASFFVYDQAPFTNDAGYPDSFNPRTGKGLSDHLPILADFYQIRP